MSVVFIVCVYVCTMYLPRVQSKQWGIRSPEIRARDGLSCHVVLGAEPGSSVTGASAFDH